jgi:hypothetical protein
MQFHKRKGIGTVVGAAFFLLILLTGFSAFMYQLTSMKNYAYVINEMQEVDRKRISEDIGVLSVTTTALDKLNITVRNIGSYQSHLIFLGIRDDATSSYEYYGIDFYVDPAETVTDVRNESIIIPSGSERELQLITGLGSIYTFSYPEDSSAGTGDDGQASVTIKGRTPFNPSKWNLQNLTAYVSGSISDLSSNDDIDMVFLSYGNGTIGIVEDIVDNNLSNVDGSADVGIHSGFSSQQVGPDSSFDILQEEDIANYSLISQESFEGSWPPAGWIETGNWNQESQEAYHGSESADFDGGGGGGRSGDLDTTELNTSDASAIYVEFWYRDRGTEAGEFLLQYWNGATWNSVNDLGSTTSEDQWLHYSENITDNQYFIEDFKMRWSAVGIDGGESVYVDYVSVLKETPDINYLLDLEVQWTNVDYSGLNKTLCVYSGSMGLEDILIDVWYGSSWVNILTDLTSGWNNVSIISYLDSSNFTIRFRDGVNSSDLSRDTWEIDVSLLRLDIGGDYIAEVEFEGISNAELWDKLVWEVDSSWDINDVNVTIQLYNYNQGSYVSTGNGFLNFLSNSTPDTDELKTQTISSLSADYRNSTGGWKVKIKGVKVNTLQYQMKVDLIEIKAVYSSSGNNIPFDVWWEYEIEALTPDGDPIPYAYASIYGNGTSLSFQNYYSKTPVSNPGWIYLDENGLYIVEIMSSNGSTETFYIKSTVGSIVGEKTITQEAP